MKGDQLEVKGELEVSLLRAEGHADNDFLKNVEPVVILKYACTQHRVSCVSYAPTVSGTYPWWNQFFYFDVITPHITELTMKLYDNATDKFIGYANIPLDMVFFVDTVAEDAYQIINDDGVYAGDIYVALTFTPEKKD